jgi:WD40 repeat protein
MKATRVGGLARDEARSWLFGGPLRIQGICDIVGEFASTFEGVCVSHIDAAKFDGPLCMLPDGRLVSQKRDHTIDVWTDGRITHALKGHTERVMACILLPFNKLASASIDGTVRVFDLARQTCVNVLCFDDSMSYHHPINLVALPNDVLAACYTDGTIRVWSIRHDDQWMMTLRDHDKAVCALALLPNGLMASGSHDATVRLWDLPRKSCVRVLKGHDHAVMDLVTLPCGRLASCGDDWTVRIWDPDKGVCVHVLEGHTRCVVGLAVMSNGLLVSVAYDHTFRVWDTDSGSGVITHNDHCKSDITSMTALPNCQLAAVYFNGTVEIWG